jgi:thiamine kinase-like enzyme
MSLTPEAVLGAFPEWDGSTATELKGGLTNTTWLVECDGRKGVLKIDEGVRGDPYNSRSAEASIQSIAAEHGLASAVIHASERVLLTEYVEGVVWTLDCLEDDANIGQLAVALRKLHSLPLTGRTFDALGAARNYARRIIDPDVDRVRDCLGKIEAGPLPPNLCFCHNDLVVDNIVNTPETRFLDWEYACDNDPFFDLATIAAHHDLTKKQRGILLDAYCDGAGERWYPQLLRQAEIYEALLYLWECCRA